ncbi:hypothetical protein [Hyphococcus luteus]|uniref:Uncharacterized protein n=1 Tax=Hyphococcus luteus TaxID=2058213 RepID=A0A2S7K4R8_9PROT|nr:hypothetical protein [Marinicaulis flavus]PQA87504.1 hypothetical protein CW354_11930 [Marinicaulis flavus]
MTDEAVEHAHDAEEHKKSYDAIMGAATEIGVPFSMALAMFFTGLVTRSGVLMAILMGVIVYVLAHIVVKLFFSHPH